MEVDKMTVRGQELRQRLTSARLFSASEVQMQERTKRGKL